MESESVCFYNEAYSFFKSGMILRESSERDCEENRLLGPITYLFRHSMELLLKSFIINHYISNGIVKWDEVMFNKRKLTSIHSLKSLFNILIQEKFQFYGEDYNVNDLFWTISDVESLDMDSTYFRYPINKNKKINDKSIEKAEDIEAYRHAPCCLGALLSAKCGEYYDFPNILEIEDGLYEALKYLFKYSCSSEM